MKWGALKCFKVSFKRFSLPGALEVDCRGHGCDHRDSNRLIQDNGFTRERSGSAKKWSDSWCMLNIVLLDELAV